jgi:hypothetical protein
MNVNSLAFAKAILKDGALKMASAYGQRQPSPT